MLVEQSFWHNWDRSGGSVCWTMIIIDNQTSGENKWENTRKVKRSFLNSVLRWQKYFHKRHYICHARYTESFAFTVNITQWIGGDLNFKRNYCKISQWRNAPTPKPFNTMITTIIIASYVTMYLIPWILFSSPHASKGPMEIQSLRRILRVWFDFTWLVWSLCSLRLWSRDTLSHQLLINLQKKTPQKWSILACIAR